MAIWFVRPDTSHNVTRDGLSYSTAWGGKSEIIWASMTATDTLMICGSHNYTSSFSFSKSGESKGNEFTYNFSYLTDPGSITFTGSFFINAYNLSHAKLITPKVNGDTASCMWWDGAGNVSNLQIYGGTFNGGSSGISIGSKAIADHYFDGVTFKNHSGPALSLLLNVGGVTVSNVTIKNCKFDTITHEAIRYTVESPAWTTSKFDSVLIESNTFRNVGRSPLWIRTSDVSDTGILPVIWNTNIVVKNNNIRFCGTIAGVNGQHGGLAIGACDGASIHNNVIWDVYVTGAGIQTAGNKNITIFNNDIRRVRSGTPTINFNSGFPIDGNGIFFDNKTINGVAYNNYIEDLITTGIVNSGCALAFWDGAGAIFYNNVVKNCVQGSSYGAATEYDNAIINNLFINCGTGIKKIGTVAPIGLPLVKNNTYINCTTFIDV